MGLRQIINCWRKQEIWLKFSEITAVLHTSCVNYPTEDLWYLKKLGMRWCIPDNVRVELNLLLGSPGLYGENARLILQFAQDCGMAGRRADGGKWDLEQLYRHCKRGVKPDTICYGAMLFLFGDLAKQNEFLENAVSLAGHYVLVGTGWDCVIGCSGRIHELSCDQEMLRKSAKAFWSDARVHKVGNTVERNPLEQLRRIYTVKASGTTRYTGLHAAQFRKTGDGGSYGRIFEMSLFEGKLLKVYKKEMALRGEDIGKLNALALHGVSMGHLPLAMPEEMLCWTNEKHENILIGYVMKKLRGSPIRSYCTIGWEAVRDPYDVLRTIARILVELHCRHILVNDLSYNNILVGEDGSVSVVDCDSFQICDYPGGLMTPLYRHPQVSMQNANRCLRQPRYEYFALAVLMFQCVMHADPLPPNLKGSEAMPTWDNMEFPLEWNSISCDKIDKNVFAAWREQDDAFRKVFSDIFHFRTDCSVGALMREMGLV